MNRFDGGCEVLDQVNVDELVDWVSQISSSTWPDWGKGPDRPAVVNDPEWEGLRERTETVVSELLKHFNGCHDTYRSITTIHPGDLVPYHCDTCHPGWVTRIHVPLMTNPYAWFITGGKRHHLEVGKAYQVNPGKPHSVVNNGKTTRIHLMFDVMNGD